MGSNGQSSSDVKRLLAKILVDAFDEDEQLHLVTRCDWNAAGQRVL